MSINTFGHLFRVTTWGESHGPALGATVDGCPPGVAIDEGMIQQWLDKRKPGQNKYTTQRREADQVRILSGTFEGVTTGTPVQLMIENTDQRSKDYGDIKDKFRPGHADITYFQKYGVRDYRGGGRSSARETASRVAAGGVARAALAQLAPDLQITGYMVQMGPHRIDRSAFDWDQIGKNPFWVPDAQAAADWADYLDGLRKSGSSVGAIIEVTARGVPAGLGAPIYGKLDTDLAAAMMSINAVKGVEIGEGMSAAMLTGEANADEIFKADPADDIVEIFLPGAFLGKPGNSAQEIYSPEVAGKERWFDIATLNSFEEREGGMLLRIERHRLESRQIPHSNLPVHCHAQPRFSSNHAGGILGGISTGQDVVVRFAVKPTSSILTTRKTITKKGEETEIITKGRHDPCVGIRAVPVGEAMMACVLLDHMLLHRGQVGENQGHIG
ncbi:MAG: chorismate synthase [Sulfitobacter sp.]|nr:chorismate synthase [Sulfitobacter sp.]